MERTVELPATGSLIDPTLQLELEWVPSAFAAEPCSPVSAASAAPSAADAAAPGAP